ncbi:MAG TPA: RluA family pseudouridine synthase [Polyangiaceae bacterium]|nr:RluA family pseudouridine synthase [Polyangiaceae bacterium]
MVAPGSLRFVLGPEQRRERVDKVLPSLLDGVSRATVQRWIAEGRVRVDGRECRAKDDVRAGSVVEVEPGAPLPSTVEPDPSVPFTVLYEDPALLVVNKPAGVVVHPGRGNWEHTLVAGLLARPGFERAPFDSRDPMGPLRPGIVHRIDKGTSGVLVVAKTDAAREGLKRQLAEHSVARRYRAITSGVPKAGRIETLHARSRLSRLRFTSLTEKGRRAVTEVTVDERLAAGRAAVVTCVLETGRTHQIRVHLAERAGAPVFGDALYGKKPSDPALREIWRALGHQALHAEVLGFSHPETGERLTFTAPPPPEFERAVESLRALGA